jgi:Fe-S-cluster containining protein
MATDETLIQIVDKALAETAAKSGSWLVCRASCWQCCTGAFAINALDAVRLRGGLRALRQSEPARAVDLEQRATSYIDRVRPSFPGDAVTGALGEDETSQAAFAEFANEEVCPVLDPVTKTCDLYAARPMTCRVFGPPVRTEQGLGVCELCYTDAGPEEIAACEMVPDPANLEAELVLGLPLGLSKPETTIVAFALLTAE